MRSPVNRFAPLLLGAAFLTGAPALRAAGKKPPHRPGQAPASAPAKTAPTVRLPPPAEKPPEKHEAPPLPAEKVLFLTELPNPNDYTLFANGGGWDGNWYVGYNTCWISELPAIPQTGFTRAFLGARLGRMKTEAAPGRPPWEKKPIHGEIQIAVNSEPQWPQSHRFLLAETEAIPLEGDPENAVEGVGESQWFWVEIPIRLLSSEKNQYVALFTPSSNLKDAQHSPILAAGWGDTRQNTWLNSAVKGEPPFNAADALKTNVTYFDPAIAIKLVSGPERPLKVVLIDPPRDAVLQDKLVLSADITAQDLDKTWVEYSTDTRNWSRLAQALRAAPYSFTLKRDKFPPGRIEVRISAIDVFGDRGTSDLIPLTVAPPPPSKKK